MNKNETSAFNPKPINRFILSLNRTSYTLILLIYVAILVLVLFLVNPVNKTVTLTPDYDHIVYPEDIHPQISIYPYYTYNESKKQLNVVYYDIKTAIQGRFKEGNEDPKLAVNRFLMSAHLINNKMYYFTDITNLTSGSNAPTQFISDSDGSNAPQKIFTSLSYVDSNGETKVARSREDILLELKNKELFTHNNTISHIESETLITDLRLRFAATKTDTQYRISTRITLNDYAKQYHVDMQSWIVTADGTAYPFIGVYAYQNEDSTFVSNSQTFPRQVDPKYIYSELHYYLPNQKVQTIRYQVLIDDLPTSNTQDPVYTDTIPEPPTNISNFPWRTINIIAWPSLVGIAIAGVVYYYIKNKKKDPQ